ncbi:MAG: mqnB [Pedobacter sp.]|jgi:futalosine hydrolase|nr:mqnB [Pedobacter sp.]
MKTLVVAATIDEVRGIYEHFKLPLSSFAEGTDFDILITGVGMTATAFALGKTLSSAYKQVLNLGIAGAFDKAIPLGTLIYISKDVFSELGVEDNLNFIPVEELGFGESAFFCKKTNNIHLNHLVEGTGITVNTVHGNAESIAKVIARLNPTLESMEGAAVFYACRQTGQPCIQVRAVSNYVEVRNKASWKIGLAIKNLNDWAIVFLTKP